MVYSYVNSIKAIKDSIRALEDDEGKREKDPLKIVTMLSDQFKSVFEKDNMITPEISHMKHLEQEYDLVSLTNKKEEVYSKKLIS